MKRKKGKLGKIILVIAIAAIAVGALNKNDNGKDAGTRSAGGEQSIQTETQLKADSQQIITEDPSRKEPAVSSGKIPAAGSPAEPPRAEATIPEAAGKEEPAAAPKQEETAAPAAQEEGKPQAPAQEETAVPAPADESQTAEKRDPNSISPELKDFLDSYEKFVDQYCAFLESYNASDFSQMLRYAELMTQYTDFAEKADAWNETELTDAETVYYVETLNRINVKLLKVSQKLN